MRLPVLVTWLRVASTRLMPGAEPLVGVISALVVAQWAYALIRDTGRVLLDREMNPEAVEEIKEAVESDGDSRLTDLHLLRVGIHEFAVVASVVTDEARGPQEYKDRLRQHEELAHVTIEVNRCREPVAFPMAAVN